MTHRPIENISDLSDGSIDGSQQCVGSDDNFSSKKDQETCNDSELDKMPFELHKKKVIQDMKMKLMSGSSHVPQKIKNSLDVVCLGESKFSSRCKSQSLKTDEVYNASLQLTNKSQGLCSLFMNSGLSSSGGKVPHGPRRILIPSKHSTHPYGSNRCCFHISDRNSILQRYLLLGR